MAAISTAAISSALRTIQARLLEIRQQTEALAQEQAALEQAERSLIPVLGEMPGPDVISTARDNPPAGRQASLRSQLQAALRDAGAKGRTVQHLRRLFPEAKGTTLAATLSNLKRAGLIDTREGHWLCRKVSENHSHAGGGDIAEIGVEPDRWHRVNECHYEVFTHPRTGVSLARRA